MCIMRYCEFVVLGDSEGLCYTGLSEHTSNKCTKDGFQQRSTRATRVGMQLSFSKKFLRCQIKANLRVMKELDHTLTPKLSIIFSSSSMTSHISMQTAGNI